MIDQAAHLGAAISCGDDDNHTQEIGTICLQDRAHSRERIRDSMHKNAPIQLAQRDVRAVWADRAT